MKESQHTQAGATDAASAVDGRSTARAATVRLVEYTPDSALRTGSAAAGAGLSASRTRDAREMPRLALAIDESSRGLRIETSERLAVGSLLRVVVRDRAGEPERECLARVRWRSCSARRAGHFSAGLALLEDDEHEIPIGYRPARHRVAISA